MAKFGLLLTNATAKYLREVWGYRAIADVDPVTAHAILENCEDPGAKDVNGTEIWTADFELKRTYLAQHGLSQTTTAAQLRKMTRFRNRHTANQVAYLKGEAA